MKGYEVSFYTEQNRHVEGKTSSEWLMPLAEELGIAGVTTFAGVESFGADRRRHSARFFELIDQPIEIMMAVTEAQATALFEKIKVTETRLFYVKTPIEYGELGTQSMVSIEQKTQKP